MIEVKLTDGKSDIILITHKGMSIRFNETDVRHTGRVSQGVKGISLRKDDYIISMGISPEDEEACLLIVTENGYGKRTKLDEYRPQYRGGKGVRTYKITKKTGNVAGARIVNQDDDILLINTDGTIIRIKVSEINVLGRATQGVTLMRIDQESKIVGLARVEGSYEDEIDTDEGIEADTDIDTDIDIDTDTDTDTDIDE